MRVNDGAASGVDVVENSNSCAIFCDTDECWSCLNLAVVSLSWLTGFVALMRKVEEALLNGLEAAGDAAVMNVRKEEIAVSIVWILATMVMLRLMRARLE